MHGRQAVVTVLVFAVALLATVAQAASPKPRIDIKPQYEPYEPIIATVEQEATVYFWECPETVQAIEVDNGRTLHIWAAPGTHRIQCMLLTIDWVKHSVQKQTVRMEFTVGKPEPIINPYRPDPSIRKLTGPVTALELSRSDASQLAKLFHQLGIDVKAVSATRAGSRSFPFASCQSFADEMTRRGTALGLRGKYPGLAAAVTGVLKSALGEAERPLDRTKAAALCETLAWATWETGKGR